MLAVLRDDFPDVTISKIRYLESEDLVHPQRTPSGYRKFSRADVSRLRYVLAAQRDQYLPLRVIKDHLDALDRGEPLPAGAGGAGDRAAARRPTTTARPAGRPLTPEQFARAAGLEPEQLADCVQFGLLATDADGRHPAARPAGRPRRRRAGPARHRAAAPAGLPQRRRAGGRPGRAAGRAGAAGPLGGGADPGHGEAAGARGAVRAAAHGTAGGTTAGTPAPLTPAYRERVAARDRPTARPAPP